MKSILHHSLRKKLNPYMIFIALFLWLNIIFPLMAPAKWTYLELEFESSVPEKYEVFAENVWEEFLQKLDQAALLDRSTEVKIAILSAKARLQNRSYAIKIVGKIHDEIVQRWILVVARSVSKVEPFVDKIVAEIGLIQLPISEENNDDDGVKEITAPNAKVALDREVKRSVEKLDPVPPAVTAVKRTRIISALDKRRLFQINIFSRLVAGRTTFRDERASQKDFGFGAWNGLVVEHLFFKINEKLWLGYRLRFSVLSENENKFILVDQRSGQEYGYLRLKISYINTAGISFQFFLNPKWKVGASIFFGYGLSVLEVSRFNIVQKQKASGLIFGAACNLEYILWRNSKIALATGLDFVWKISQTDKLFQNNPGLGINLGVLF